MEEEHRVYKYVCNNEIIYIGKTDNSLKGRIIAHSKESKFRKYLLNSQVFYIELANKTETNFMECYLINKYKPILNVTDNREGKTEIEMQEPKWLKFENTEYDILLDKFREKLEHFECMIKLQNMLLDLTTQLKSNQGVVAKKWEMYMRGDKSGYFIPDKLIKCLFKVYKLDVDTQITTKGSTCYIELKWLNHKGTDGKAIEILSNNLLYDKKVMNERKEQFYDNKPYTKNFITGTNTIQEFMTLLPILKTA